MSGIIGGINAPAIPTSEQLLPALADFIARTGHTPTWYSRSDEASGDVRDHVAAVDLTVGSTAPQYHRFHTKKRGLYIPTTTVTQGWNADINDLADQAAVIGLWFATSGAVAADRPLIGRYAATRYLISHVRSSGGAAGVLNRVQLLINDGTRTQTVTIDKVVTDNVIRLLLIKKSITGAALTARLCGIGEAAVTAAGTTLADYTTLSGGTTPKFFLGHLTGVQYGQGHWFGGQFCIFGAAAEAVDLGDMSRRLGAG